MEENRESKALGDGGKLRSRGVQTWRKMSKHRGASMEEKREIRGG